jgi:hypothetical protein
MMEVIERKSKASRSSQPKAVEPPAQPVPEIKINRTYTREVVLNMVTTRIGPQSWRTVQRWQACKKMQFPKHRVIGGNPVLQADEVDAWFAKMLNWK